MPHILSDRFEIAFRNQSEAAVGRFAAWRDSIEIWKAFPLFGVGPGGFRYAFPHFQTVGLLGTYNNPHQEPIALLTELGLVGIAPIFFAAALIVRRLTRLRSVLSTTDHTQTAGLIAALAMPILHSFGDFPLRTPSTAFIFCILLGVALRQADSVAVDAENPTPQPSWIDRIANALDRRRLQLAVRFATVALAGVALIFCVKIFMANPWIEWTPGVAEREVNPNNPDPLYLTRCAYQSALDPLDGDAFALIARARFASARTATTPESAATALADARQTAEAGLRGSPAHRELHHLLGGILIRMGEIDAGARSLDNQIWLTPADPSLMSACGRMLASQYRSRPDLLPSIIAAFKLAVAADPKPYASPALNALIAGGAPMRCWKDIFRATPAARAVYAEALDRIGLPAAALAEIEKKTESGAPLVTVVTDNQLRLNLRLLKTRILIKTGRTDCELAKTLDAAYQLQTDSQLETFFDALAPAFETLPPARTLDALNPLKESGIRHPPKGMMWIIARAHIKSGGESAGYEIIDELHRIFPEMKTARALVDWNNRRRQPEAALHALNETMSAFGASLTDSERLYIYEQRARALLTMKQSDAARTELEQALRLIEANPKLQSSRSRIDPLLIQASR